MENQSKQKSQNHKELGKEIKNRDLTISNLIAEVQNLQTLFNERNESFFQLEIETRLIREGNNIIREGLLKSIYENSLEKY